MDIGCRHGRMECAPPITSLLSAIISTLGLSGDEAAIRELGVAQVDDLFNLTDADLHLIDMDEKQVDYWLDTTSSPQHTRCFAYRSKSLRVQL